MTLSRKYLKKSKWGVSRQPKMSKLSTQLKARLQKAGAVLLSAVGLYLLLSLASYYPNDPSWANTQSLNNIQNLGGLAGAWISYSLYFLFGYVAPLLLPAVIFIIAWQIFTQHSDGIVVHLTQGVGYLFALFSLCGLISMHFTAGAMPASAGGQLGGLIAQGLVTVFGGVGATLLLLALFIGSIHLVTTLSWFKLMDLTGGVVLRLVKFTLDVIDNLKEKRISRAMKQLREESVDKRKMKIGSRKQKTPRIEPQINSIQTSKRVKKEKQTPLFTDSIEDGLPPLDSLDNSNEKTKGVSKNAIEVIAKQLEIKLADFGVEAEVVGAQSGPVITRFELTLSRGTKANRITALEKDLARALSVPSVRVVEIIPGKSTIGIEVPNETRETVLLNEILGSEAYDKANSPLTLGLGKSIAGAPILVDLERMPHLLVAGTTGSGKSVAVHSMLMSILFKASHQQVRLILIDPKMLELNSYEGIPHLLTPVITDMKYATNALKWVVAEMERRYRLMSALEVRNIGGYNRKITQATQESKPLLNPLKEEEGNTTPLVTMPYIVVVIDEFADMIMIVGKRIEDLIARLAQKARAAGIHLLLATQRPSVDVITGQIKANIPARIAFQVSSKIDSRTILDQNGAEQLLGQGDMLYVSPGTSIVERIHGAFVSDDEVQKVTNFLKKKGKAEYIDLEDINSNQEVSENHAGSEADPLYDQVVALVIETRKTSISYIQRRFRIGYNRAARIVEDMEAAGVISQVQTNGTREVLAPPQQ